MKMPVFRSVVGEGWFARLDFRSKLFLIAVVTAVAFVWESPLLEGVLMVAVVLACLLAGVAPAYLFQVLMLAAPFYLLVILMQGFFAGPMLASRTGQVTLRALFTLPGSWWAVGGSSFSLEGVLYALNIIFKTLTMTLIISLGVFTTDPNNIVVSLVRLRVPYRFAFVFSSTLRFFPLLFQEAQTIFEAQRLRGVPLERMWGLPRVRLYASAVVPLILNALVKSQTLEVVLQSKAFSGDARRSYFHESRLAAADYVLLSAAALFFVVAVIGYAFWNIGRFGGPI
jgi:energy-coupling factor transport system permease protein